MTDDEHGRHRTSHPSYPLACVKIHKSSEALCAPVTRPTTIQADSYLPDTLMLWIGGLRTYASRINFYLGVPNTLMIGVLFYHQSPIVQSIFPTVYHWVGFIVVVVVPGAVFTDRFLFHPAQITYNAHQGARENRNPAYREIMKVGRQLDRLEGFAAGEHDVEG